MLHSLELSASLDNKYHTPGMHSHATPCAVSAKVLISARVCRAAAIHGDMDQHSRMAVLHDFKNGRHHVLVATDVAARGLDIKSIKSVVNYDAAKEINTHVHRIGRTGRAGDKEGTAYTLVTPYETRFAGKPAMSCTHLFVKLWTTAYHLRLE